MQIMVICNMCCNAAATSSHMLPRLLGALCAACRACMLVHAPLQASDVGTGCACALRVSEAFVAELRASGHRSFLQLAAFNIGFAAILARFAAFSDGDMVLPSSTNVRACFLCIYMRIGVFRAL